MNKTDILFDYTFLRLALCLFSSLIYKTIKLTLTTLNLNMYWSFSLLSTYQKSKYFIPKLCTLPMTDITINEAWYKCYSYNQQVGISYKYKPYPSEYSNITKGYYYEYFCPGSEKYLQYASPNPLNTEEEVCSCCNRIDSFFLFNRHFNIAVDYVMEMVSKKQIWA